MKTYSLPLWISVTSGTVAGQTLRGIMSIALTLLLCACNDVSTPYSSGSVATAVLLPLSPGNRASLCDFPLERVSYSGSHRDAYRIPAGKTQLTFEVVQTDHSLIFDLLSSENSEVRQSIYQDKQGKPLPTVKDHSSWSSQRIALTGQNDVTLLFDSEAPFYLAECTLLGKPSGKPDVLIYLIDTLRQDHLGCYYYPVDTSPNIDRFAEDAVRFSSLIPMSSWTRPSVATLLTGVMDYSHHALSHEDHLRQGLPSLAKTLEINEWTTHGITTNCVVTDEFGFGKDFQWYEELLPQNKSAATVLDEKAVDHAIAAIAQPGDMPLGMYLHLIAPHRDYEPPVEYRELFMPKSFVGVRAQTRVMQDMALYDAEIRFSDDQFGRTIQALKDAGRYENALIVLLSDHGEQFMEHGELAHANTLHYHELKVPLLIKLPGNSHAGREIRHIVQMADIAPTILAALGLTIPGAMEGRSLIPLITLKGTFPPKPAFARLRIGERHLYMAQTQYLKYIYDVVREQGQWYDLQEDPLEYRPLFLPPEGGNALRIFAEEQASRPIPEKGGASPPLTDTQTEQLEALGYL